MNNRVYLKKIVIIICLTNIPAFLTLPLFFDHSLGWILGSIASLIRIIWLAHDVRNSIDFNINKSRLRAIKGYYFRFLFLLVYSVLIVLIIKPDIIFFGLGLLTSNFAIYFNQIIEAIRNSRIFRGKDAG